MNKGWCCAVQQGIRLTIQVTPNARKTEAAGIQDDALKIRLQAQPIEGKANDALIRYLAKVLNVRRSAVTIVHGHAARRKIIDIGSDGLHPDMVCHLFPEE